jgi:hypothetical protein
MQNHSQLNNFIQALLAHQSALNSLILSFLGVPNEHITTFTPKVDYNLSGNHPLIVNSEEDSASLIKSLDEGNLIHNSGVVSTRDSEVNNYKRRAISNMNTTKE